MARPLRMFEMQPGDSSDRTRGCLITVVYPSDAEVKARFDEIIRKTDRMVIPTPNQPFMLPHPMAVGFVSPLSVLIWLSVPRSRVRLNNPALVSCFQIDLAPGGIPSSCALVLEEMSAAAERRQRNRLASEAARDKKKKNKDKNICREEWKTEHARRVSRGSPVASTPEHSTSEDDDGDDADDDLDFLLVDSAESGGGYVPLPPLPLGPPSAGTLRLLLTQTVSPDEAGLSRIGTSLRGPTGDAPSNSGPSLSLRARRCLSGLHRAWRSRSLRGLPRYGRHRRRGGASPTS